MPGPMTIRVGEARWYSLLNSTNGATTAPTNITNGIDVPRGWRHETMHVAAIKSNVCDLDLYGYIDDPATGGNAWLRFDSIAFSSTKPEGQRVLAATAFRRICVVRTDGNVSNAGCNVIVGFSEG